MEETQNQSPSHSNFSSPPSSPTSFSMENLLGLLRIRVIRGINLAIRDVLSSDPYVVIKMGKQVCLIPLNPLYIFLSITHDLILYIILVIFIFWKKIFFYFVRVIYDLDMFVVLIQRRYNFGDKFFFIVLIYCCNFFNLTGLVLQFLHLSLNLRFQDFFFAPLYIFFRLCENLQLWVDIWIFGFFIFTCWDDEIYCIRKLANK